MVDFAMVGYADSDGDQNVGDEDLAVIRLSDYADSKSLILFDVSAGWCETCQDATEEQASLIAEYGGKGLMIVQVLFEGGKLGELPTVDFAKAWIAKLMPAGALGIDPGRLSVPFNTLGSLPLTMLLDAKTRKVLSKMNGHHAQELRSQIQTHILQ